MRSRYFLTTQATADLEGIADYHSEISPSYSARLVQSLTAAFAFVGRFPGSGTASDTLRPGLRRKVVEGYLVFFRGTPTGTQIVRVLHGARNIGPDDFPSE